MQPFTIMCKRTVTIHVVKHLKPQKLLKEPMYNCGQHFYAIAKYICWGFNCMTTCIVTICLHMIVNGCIHKMIKS